VIDDSSSLSLVSEVDMSDEKSHQDIQEENHFENEPKAKGNVPQNEAVPQASRPGVVPLMIFITV